MEQYMHEGHRQRLRTRFLKNGLSDFDEHNVLEFMLFFAIPRMDTNVIAHNLISEFGSLSRVFDAPFEMLINVEGVGENAATLIKLMPQLCRRYLESRGKEVEDVTVLDTKKKIIQHLMPKFVGQINEILVLICFDNKRKVIFSDKIIEGSVNITGVSIRKIVEQVVKQNACAVILAHNHPSGLAIPSADDIATTKQIQNVLSSMGVRFLDHIIVADNDAVSLEESGFFN